MSLFTLSHAHLNLTPDLLDSCQITRTTIGPYYFFQPSTYLHPLLHFLAAACALAVLRPGPRCIQGQVGGGHYGPGLTQGARRGP